MTALRAVPSRVWAAVAALALLASLALLAVVGVGLRVWQGAVGRPGTIAPQAIGDLPRSGVVTVPGTTTPTTGTRRTAAGPASGPVPLAHRAAVPAPRGPVVSPGSGAEEPVGPAAPAPAHTVPAGVAGLPAQPAAGTAAGTGAVTSRPSGLAAQPAAAPALPRTTTASSATTPQRGRHGTSRHLNAAPTTTGTRAGHTDHGRPAVRGAEHPAPARRAHGHRPHGRGPHAHRAPASESRGHGHVQSGHGVPGHAHGR